MESTVIEHETTEKAARLGYVALKTFFAIADDWGLSATDQRILLGGIGKTTLSNYKRLPEISLSRDLLDRISYLMGIQKALVTLLGSRERATRWIHAPNAAEPFFGKSALECLKGGSMRELFIVRQYLDSQLV